ncbi:hypothetical protein HGRIS_012404 [Hohenbuehelia grisea]|uniref:Uncharacterized protein n=1 Tax=Hohenbuehelia grisea TaxID=104357 RepID=A0ABR3IS93_9AGAR
MFGLFRRISGSIIPRPDRPWQEDATSNAPQIGRKRRLSSTERDLEDLEDERVAKKNRGLNPASVSDDADQEHARATSSTPLPQGKEDTEGVKEVTQGVEEVDLGDKATVAPESVPLPEGTAGELDEKASSPPPVAETASEVEQAFQPPSATKKALDKDDVASSRESSVAPQAVEEDAKEKGDGATPGVISSTVGSESAPAEVPSTLGSEPDKADEAGKAKA